MFPAEGKCAWPSGVIATADAGAAKLVVREGKTVLYTGFAPVTGKVCVDLHQPVGGMMVARGFLEGRVFDVPTLTRKGQTTVVSLPIIREDMLDGRLELSINLMFGKGMSVDRIRIIDGQKTEQHTSD